MLLLLLLLLLRRLQSRQACQRATTRGKKLGAKRFENNNDRELLQVAFVP